MVRGYGDAGTYQRRGRHNVRLQLVAFHNTHASSTLQWLQKSSLILSCAYLRCIRFVPTYKLGGGKKEKEKECEEKRMHSTREKFSHRETLSKR